MIKKIKQLLIKILYLFSCLFLRDKKKFIFIGWHKTNNGETLADNAKYFYLYMSQQQGVQALWLAKSTEIARTLRQSGLQSHYEKSLLGIWHALTAKFFVIDAFLQPYNYMLSGRAHIIQLLHGKGMKKKGYSEPQLRQCDVIFNTSPFAISLLPENFKKGADLVVSGYSRNDQFFKTIPHSEIGIDTEMLAHLKKLKERSIPTILYAPTFRRGEREFQFKSIDRDRLASWAQKNNVHFLLSLHNKYRGQQQSHALDNHISTLSEGDIYPLLNHIDILVTDYSSSFVDFLLLDRPIIFYPYDLETYSQKEGLAADYDSITPGPKVRTFNDLLSTLDRYISGDDEEWKNKRKEVCDLYHTYKDGNSSDRIWSALKTKYFD